MACLVNHSYKDGLFTLQIPISSKVEDGHLLTKNTNKVMDMILNCLSDDLSITKECIDIKHTGLWNLNALMANRFYNLEKRIILAGDAAHSFPPSGGFGMNTGIADVQNLAHKIHGIINSDSKTSKQ